MKIGQVEIGASRVYVIAEAGVNHNGNVDLAKKLIDAAKAAGADAVKFQTFTVDEIVTEHAGQAEYQKENTGKAESQASMLKKLALSHEDFKELKQYAGEQKIEFLSTPFSIPDADFLQSIRVAAFKVSSGDLTNIPFLKHLASFKKPILISTGMATLAKVEDAVNALGVSDIIVLQCTSEYPAPRSHANLRVIETFKKEFGVPIGYSDHTEGMDAAVYAASLGAALIEKHFTLDRTLPGPDHKASLEPQELKAMIEKIRGTKIGSISVPEEVLGSAEKKPSAEESVTAKLVRKGVAARSDIKKGETLTDANIFIARPEGPVPPKEWDSVLGKKAVRDIARGTSLSWDMIS